MDSSLAAAIDVIIDPSKSIQGERETIAALDRIIAHGGRVSAANDNVASSFGRAGAASRRAANDASGIGRVLDEVRGRAAAATPEIGGLVQNLMGLGPMAAVAGGVALAIGAIGTAAIKAAAQTQAWNAQIETITRDSEKAKETYAALVQFGNSTPFDTGQSVQAFVKLRQMGLAATEDRLRSFGNTAAASGKSLNQMIEAVADAGTGEFERLKEFGIKTKTEGQKVTFTMAGVKTTVANNSVAITKYLENIGNTKFGGAMEKQMNTLNGAFSNVQDSIRGMLSAIGEGALGQSVKEIAKSIANGVSYITPFMASIGNLFGGIVLGVGSVLDGLGQLWAGFGGAEQANNDVSILTVAFNLLGEGAQVMGSAIGSVFGFIGNLVSSIGEMWRSSFGSLLGDTTTGFEEGGRSWGNSIVGILRAVKYVVGQMPKLFQVAVSDIMKMFRDMGNGIMAFLSGDWKKGIELFKKPQMVSTQKAAGAIGTGAYATYKDEKGAAAAIGRLMGKTGKAKLDQGLDTTPDKTKDKDKKGGKSEAEKLAEKINDFWKKLEGDSKDAEATYKALSGAADAGKNLSVVSADTAKQLEFQRLTGRAITDQEKERIVNALQTQRTNKFLSDALMQAEQRKFDLAEQQAILDAKKRGLTDEQLDVEKGVIKFRTDAQKAGVDLTNAAYLAAENKLRTDLSSAEAIERQNKGYDEQKKKLQEILDGGKSVLENHSASAELGKKLGDLNKEKYDLDAYYEKNKGKAGIEKEYQEAVRNISRAATEATTYFETRWIDAIDQLAQNFSGKFGEAISGIARALQSIRNMGTDKDGSLFGGIASLFGGKINNAYKDTAQGQAGSLASALGDPLKSLSSGFGEFKKMLTDSGQGGFGAILGKGLAKAGQGAAIGGAIGGIGNMLGLGKGFSTGANIGGTIGGLFGPIGGIIGSLGGGLIGSLFGKKAKYGTAQLTGAADAVVSGRGSAEKAGASGAAGSVQQGIANLAAELGGQVGNYLVSIGQYDGKWRVSTSGQAGEMSFGKKNKKNWATLNDFGDDQAGAIAFAIQDAIKDGAITGLSPLIQKALSTLGSDAAIQFAKDWNAAMQDYKSIIDPMGAAIDEVVNPLKVLRETMLKVGASTEDLTKLDQYRAAKLDAIYKQQTQSLRDILDQLNGDAGGVSDYSQLQSKMKQLDVFKADVAAGKTVDQDAYATLVGDIISKAGSVYGTQTGDYQSIVASLKGTTQGALDNYKSSFNAASGNGAVVSAVQAQTDAYTAQQAQTNNLLAQNNVLLQKLVASMQVQDDLTLRVQNARLAADW